MDVDKPCFEDLNEVNGYEVCQCVYGKVEERNCEAAMRGTTWRDCKHSALSPHFGLCVRNLNRLQCNN